MPAWYQNLENQSSAGTVTLPLSTATTNPLSLIPTGIVPTNSNVNLSSANSAVDTNIADYASSGSWGGNGTYGIDAKGNMYIWSTDGTNPIRLDNVGGGAISSAQQSAVTITICSPVVATGSLANTFTANGWVETINFGTNFDTTAVTNLQNMFNENIVLKNLDLSGWNVANVTNASYLFTQDAQLTNLNLTGWNLPATADKTLMFQGIPSTSVPNW
jgi:surface protein